MSFATELSASSFSIRTLAVEDSRSTVRPKVSLVQRMQPGLLHYRQICLETVEFGLFVRRPLVAAVGQIRGLQLIGKQVIHLPLHRDLRMGWVIILGQFVTLFADTHDVVI